MTKLSHTWVHRNNQNAWLVGQILVFPRKGATFALLSWMGAWLISHLYCEGSFRFEPIRSFPRTSNVSHSISIETLSIIGASVIMIQDKSEICIARGFVLVHLILVLMESRKKAVSCRAEKPIPLTISFLSTTVCHLQRMRRLAPENAIAMQNLSNH